MRCGHKHVRPMLWVGRWSVSNVLIPVGELVFDACDAVVCDCGSWLPIGPARDDERTAVEVEAARLALEGRPSTCGAAAQYGECEECGWDDYIADVPLCGHEHEPWWIGWLAAAIAEHEEPKP